MNRRWGSHILGSGLCSQVKDGKCGSGVMINKESYPLSLQIKALDAKIQQMSSSFGLFTLSVWWH